MTKPVRITIAETSYLIRRGIFALLGEIGSISFVASEISETKELKNALAVQRPDILVINPAFMTLLSLSQIKKEASNPDMKCVVLQTSLADTAGANYFDGAVSVYDSADSIRDKLHKLIVPDSAKQQEPLSQREMDIIACVVSGMTNKQIADKLYLSPHTVNSHRRNISAKLDIHTTSGLTIYAISNKLVRLDELGSKK
jgi:DNA-binding NarL/FixJ family response regulator